MIHHNNSRFMCVFKTLEHNAEGFVVYCKSCARIYVGYGTTLLSQTIDEFYAFEQKISIQYEQHADLQDVQLKQISVATAAKEVSLMYSLQDLESLHAILQNAKERLLLEKLFVFHEN